MSTTLYWEPAHPVIPRGRYDYPIKGVLARKFLKSDGSLAGEFIMNGLHLDWLDGVISAAAPVLRDQAQEIVDAIKEHGEIRVWIGE